MDVKDWFLCPNENCLATLDIKSCTYWEILMHCPECKNRVILKRYIDGQFNNIFAQHSELSESQREYLNGEDNQ